MIRADPLKAGDFAGSVGPRTRRARKQRQPPGAPAALPAAEPARRHSVQEIVDGEDPEDQYADDWRALDDVPGLEDEDLVRREDDDA